MKASERQVGGSHYKNVEVQPIQIAYMLGCTPLWVKVCKYITRTKEDHTVDLQKALHCVELENEMMEFRCRNYMVEMNRYNQEDIEKFSNQYEDSEFIDLVLQHMYFGFYKQAAEAICEKAGVKVELESEVV